MKKCLLRTFVILFFVIITAASIHRPGKFPFRSPVTNKFFSYKKYLKIFRTTNLSLSFPDYKPVVPRTF